MKRHLLIATLFGIVMAAVVPCAHADLYVISYGSNSVLRYNEMTGAFIDKFVSFGSSDPRGLLIGHDGNLYLSSFSTNTVMRYDGTTGAPLPAPGQTGAVFASGGGLQGAAGLILGRDGNLYVNSQTNNRVLRYSGTTGVFLDVFVPAGSGGLKGPRKLLFGPDGNLYSSHFGGDGSSSAILRYDGTTGAPLPAPGQTGALFASLPRMDIHQFGFGPEGNLYIANNADSSVERFDGATGEFIDTFIPPGSGGLNAPLGPIFGPDNNVYLSSHNNNKVLRYDGTTGAFIDAFIPGGSGGLNLPTYLFFTNTDPTTLAYVPAPANRFVITAPPTAVSGTPFDVTVTALDRSGNIATGYTGTVTFTSSDPHATLPANYTFAAADKGRHTFAGVTLFTAGAQTLTVQDTADNSVTGRATMAGAAAPADHFLIAAPQAAVSGMPFDVPVTALDPYGNIATGYTGTVTFAGSDAKATLPGNYTFTAADNGLHLFAGVTLLTSGAQTLTAQDTANGSLTGSGTVAVAAAAADHFLITAPPTAVAGTPFDVTITALDPYGNVDSNYTGTATWATSDSDPGVVLPADYTFQANENGTHIFTAGVMLITPGDQTLTATDTASGITGSAAVTVARGPRPPPGGGVRGPWIPSINRDISPALGMLQFARRKHDGAADDLFAIPAPARS